MELTHHYWEAASRADGKALALADPAMAFALNETGDDFLENKRGEPWMLACPDYYPDPNADSPAMPPGWDESVSGPWAPAPPSVPGFIVSLTAPAGFAAAQGLTATESGRKPNLPFWAGVNNGARR